MTGIMIDGVTTSSSQVAEGADDPKPQLPSTDKAAPGVANGADTNGAEAALASGGRAAQVAAAVLRRARSHADGESLMSELRALSDTAAIAAQLEITGTCTLADVEEAYKRCGPFWDKNQERDIEHIVAYILEECTDMMEADRRFRMLQGKIGRRLHGRGVLTEAVLSSAQTRCHEYWARVTPGNVALVVANVTGKSPNWESADKKFDWLWRKGEWDMDKRTVKLAGRNLTAEDLEQAERQVRRKFNQPTKLVGRLPGTTAPARTDAAVAQAGGEAGQAPAANGAQQALADGAAQQQAGAPAAGAPAGDADAKAKKEGNVDLIVRRVLAKCKAIVQAQKFFDMMKRNIGKPNPTGRTFSHEDISQAWEKVTSHFSSARAGGSSSGSSSDEAEQAPAQAQAPAQQATGPSAPAVGAQGAPPEKRESSKKKRVKFEDDVSNVDCIVRYVSEKYKSMAKAEKCFEKLHETVGGPSPLGRVFTEQEITEAWLRCEGEFEAAAAAKSSKKQDKAAKTVQSQSQPAPDMLPDRKVAKKDLNNVDFIVRKVISKCDNLNKANKIFDVLQQTVGQENPLGTRIFNEQDVTEAWLRCTTYFEETKARQEAVYSSDGSGSSSSSSSGGSPQARRRGKAQEGKKGKSKKAKRAKSGLVEEELEGVLFGSDSDELSGEEVVDEEQEDEGAAMDLADFGVDDEELARVVDDGYPAESWKEVNGDVAPGYQGFNLRATRVMNLAQVGQARLEVKFDASAACPPLQPHQESVAFLLHPRSPISRMLVDHPTGSGKTREMIRVLDNYFYDPRPKIPIFPKDPVCRNFYSELLRWPNRYRDYFCCERPQDAVTASGKADWREVRFHMWDLSGFHEEEVRRLGYSIREVLEMKGMFFMGQVRRSFRVAFYKKNPGESMPVAPLRAIGYTSAGGAFSSLTESGKPMSSIMKIGFDKGSMNVYSNKVVLMDEAHNLVRTQTQYAEQLQRLRNLLFTAKNLALAGFTGTPILNEPTEGRQLLDIIKGIGAPEGDEGFLSSFPMRPQPLFPLSLPRGIPDGVLTLSRRRQLVQKVEMHGETLKMYDIKRRLGLPGRRLRAYCNVCTYHATFHEGRHGTKIKVLTFPEDCCPKLFAIAQAVCASPEKAIVMTGRMSGHIVMLELLRFLAAKADPPFQVATMDELSEFNHVSNLRGQIYRVLVADALQCSEGISFLAVRRTYLSDVPVSPSSFIQQCGRAIRMYGHRGLREDEQTVTTHLYVATLPKWMRSSTLACWALRAQKKHTSGKEVEKRARLLTARLNRAGIRTLQDLKLRIDAHGAAKLESLHGPGTGAERDRVGLSAEDVVVFLEQNGLWEEARLLRTAEKKEQEKAKVVAEGKDSLTRSISGVGIGGSFLRRSGTSATMDSMDFGEDGQDAADAAAEAAEEAAEAAEAELDGEDAMDFERALDGVLEEAGIVAPADAAVGGSAPAAVAEPSSAEAKDAEAPSKEPAAANADGESSPQASPPEASPAAVNAEAESSPQASPPEAPQTDAAMAAETSAADSAGVAGDAGAGGVAPAVSEAAAGVAGDAGAAVAEESAGAAAAEDSSFPPMEPEEGLAAALSLLQSICKDIDRPLNRSSSAATLPGADAAAAAAAAKALWKARLQEGLRRPRRCEPVQAAIRAALNPAFDVLGGNLAELSGDQAKMLRDELQKLDRIATIHRALAVLQEVKTMIGESQAAAGAPTEAAPAVNGSAETGAEAADAEAGDAEVAAAEAAEALEELEADLADALGVGAEAEVPDAAEAAAPFAADASASADAAPAPMEEDTGAEAAASPMEQDAGAPGGSEADAGSAAASAQAAEGSPQLPAAPAEAPAEAMEAEGTAPAAATQAAEASPRFEAPAEAAPAEAMQAEGTAPAAATQAAEASPRFEAPAEASPRFQAPAASAAGAAAQPTAPAPPTEAERAWRAKLAEGLAALKNSEHVKAAVKIALPALFDDANVALDGVTPTNVQRLQDELTRLQEQVEKGGAKPRALVRAMQMLYLAESADDASMSLSVETADEEALRQLSERTEEFAPALAAMRSLAVDREIFEHMADRLGDDEQDGPLTESDGSDLEKDLIGRREAAPVVLPPGWRLEWVKRKKKEMREFIDPDGNRYCSVKDVRAALARLESIQQQRAELEKALASVGNMSSDFGAPPAKRVRLRGKVSGDGFLGGAMDTGEDVLKAGELEAAFEEALEGALDDVALDFGDAADAVEEAAPAPPVLEPRPGATVVLQGLVAKPELNGQEGKLGSFIEETGRWECTLSDGSGKVNVKVANFQVVSLPVLAAKKRSLGGAAPAAAKRTRAARGGGRGRGRGAAAPPPQPAADAAEVSESD